MHFAVMSLTNNALGGIATRREVTIWFTRGTNGPSMNLLIYAPNAARKPVPAFLGLNFNGNHAINADPGITLSDRWFPQTKNGCVTNNRATENCRGKEASQWPVEKILSRGTRWLRFTTATWSRISRTAGNSACAPRWVPTARTWCSSRTTGARLARGRGA